MGRKKTLWQKIFSSDLENKSAVEVKIKTKIFEFVFYVIKDTRQWLKRLIICIYNLLHKILESVKRQITKSNFLRQIFK